MSHGSNKIGRIQGAALLATTLLGTSVFILPQMTIAIAGENALWAWMALTLSVIPVALVFGRLAGKFPHAAGPAYFVEKAFGEVAGRTIGMIFLFAVPLGAPAAILMTFQFVESLVSLSPIGQYVAQMAVLLLLLGLNLKGVQLSARLQLALTLAIVVVVFLIFGVSVNEPTGHVPVHTNLNLDTHLILAAAGLAFWSFLGVEAMAHLSGEFRRPEKDLVPAMMIGCITVGLIYILCTWLLLQHPVDTPLAMVGLFDQMLGGYGAIIIGLLGIAGGLATVNVYTASLARLAWSFSNDGVLPAYFRPTNRYGVPVRALNTLLLIMATVLTITFVTGKDLEDLISWVNGVFVIIYLASMLAAFKLLPRTQRPLIYLGCLFCFALAWGLGWQMSYSLCLLLVLAPALRWQRNLKRLQPVTANSISN